MSDHDPATRGMGGVLVAAAAAMFALHSGMPGWQIGAIFVLVGLGLPMLVGGRLSNW